jgi:ribonuclease Z
VRQCLEEDKFSLVYWVRLRGGFALGVFATVIASRIPMAATADDDRDAAQTPQTTPSASPMKATATREMYYPGTEDLAPDEMRVTACGTGMPNARPKQAAACWLVELGNGDKFLFDIGTA